MNKGQTIQKVVVSIIGGTVLLAGIAMIVLPGPAFIVIPTGLAILATQFEWARRALDAIKDRFHQYREKRRHRV